MNTNGSTPRTPEIGTVYLIGAGPGDADLITRRGWNALHSCDVVLVDALVDPALLADLPDRIERRYVGKRAGKHVMPQRDIETLMIDLAKEGKSVARLKGGDPFVFGRGGEEAVALREAGVPFQVIPGITAATAATAYAGMPLTYRRKSCYAVLFTANAAPAREGECGNIPLAEFAKLHDGTLVAYMGVRVLRSVAQQLIEGGMPENQPAAVIERGATGGQKVVRAPLKDLADKAEEAGIKPPALIILGEVTELADQVGWYEPGPLAGKRVVVTRPSGQATELVDGLRELGADVLHIPAIRFEERFDRTKWDKVIETVTNLPHTMPRWIVFTSENGVTNFFSGLRRMGKDVRWLGRLKIAVVGAATADALARFGFQPDLMPSTSTGKALGQELAEEIQMNRSKSDSGKETENTGAFVLRIRGELANPAVETALENEGVNVLAHTVYATLDAPVDELSHAWINQRDPDILIFTSGSTFQAFRRQWGEEDVDRMLKNATVVSIGPVTSSLIRGFGYDIATEADPHNNQGILEAVSMLD